MFDFFFQSTFSNLKVTFMDGHVLCTLHVLFSGFDNLKCLKPCSADICCSKRILSQTQRSTWGEKDMDNFETFSFTVYYTMLISEMQKISFMAFRCPIICLAVIAHTSHGCMQIRINRRPDVLTQHNNHNTLRAH